MVMLDLERHQTQNHISRHHVIIRLDHSSVRPGNSDGNHLGWLDAWTHACRAQGPRRRGSGKPGSCLCKKKHNRGTAILSVTPSPSLSPPPTSLSPSLSPPISLSLAPCLSLYPSLTQCNPTPQRTTLNFIQSNANLDTSTDFPYISNKHQLLRSTQIKNIFTEQIKGYICISP